jgi:hypothetical protein
LCGAAANGEPSYEAAYEKNQEDTRRMIRALQTADSASALEILGVEADRSFYENFRFIGKQIRQASGYDLVVVSTFTYREDGLLLHRVGYRVTFSNKIVFGITAHTAEGMRGLYSFRMGEIEFAVPENQIATPWLWVAYGATLLVLIFVTWMIVDCVRRPMRRWWKFLCIFGMLWLLEFSFASGGGYTSLLWDFVLPFFRMDVSLIGGLLEIRGLIPFGAILYFVMRKWLTRCYVESLKRYYDRKERKLL